MQTPEKQPTSDPFEVPDVSDLDLAFPTRYKELLPPAEDITEEEWHGQTIYCKAAEGLFFGGGALTDYGIRVKTQVDPTKVYRYLRATLGDLGPKHEHKIGGVGHMLARWCEPIP